MSTQTSTYQKYSSYEDKGVEWLGVIPESWNLLPLKYLFKETSNKGYPDLQLLSVYRDYGVVPTDSRDDNNNVPSEDLSGYKKVEIGNLVTNKMKAWQGSISISDYEGIVSPAYYIYKRTEQENNPRYLHYLLRSSIYISVYKANSKGIRPGQWDLEKKYFERIPVIIPDLATQRKITDLLDNKLQQINQIIKKKQKLVELLQEKRQALITQAVTKGLDPNAKMKDSGSEFLGAIPNNWAVKKVRYALLSHRQGYYTTESYSENGYKLLRITDFNDKAEVDTSQCPKVDEEGNISEFQLKNGDFVFARTGGAGSFGYIDFNEEKLAFASYLIRFRFHQRYNTEYIKWCFLSKPFIKGIQSCIHGSVNQNVHAEDIKEQMIAFPGDNEQTEIVDYLKRMISKVDATIEKIEQQIEKLNEYKSALIYNAVTGKIKV